MSSWGRIRQGWAPSAVAAALWLVCSAAFGYLAWQGRLPRQVLAHAGAVGMPSGVWTLTGPWVAVVVTVSTAVVFLVHLLLAGVVGRAAAGSRTTAFLALWFVAIATGVLATAPFALAAIVTEYPPARAPFILDPAGSLMLQSGYWGLLWGWIPALLASRRPVQGWLAAWSTDDGAPADAPAATPSRAGARRPRLVLTGVAVLALILSAVTVGAGSRVARLESAAAAAVAEGRTPGALPDPDVVATPPATVAPGADPGADPEADPGAIVPAWCTPDQAAILLGSQDAATGHRVLIIEAMNYTDAPCLLEGYPDIAFADANGSELDVTVNHGGSFLAEDPGSAQVTVPAGGYAVARIGWNAMPTADELVAHTLYGALYPGLERGSWPVTLDIIAGGEVSVTAWSVRDGGAHTE